jgi:hypothetical protein
MMLREEIRGDGYSEDLRDEVKLLSFQHVHFDLS